MIVLIDDDDDDDDNNNNNNNNNTSVLIGQQGKALARRVLEILRYPLVRRFVWK
jgi:hypothetical protein